MRKRNFIRRFLYYAGIIALPIILAFTIYGGFMIREKQIEIEENAIKSAYALRDNFSLVLDNAETQYDILCSNPRLSISLRHYLSHGKASYLDSVLVNSILSNFASLTNNASYVASVYYYLEGYDSILTSNMGSVVKLSQFYDLKWLDSYHASEENQWIESRNMHQFSYSEPVQVVTVYRKLDMFKGVVAVNFYADSLRQVLNAGPDLDQFFLMDKDVNLLLTGAEDDGFFEYNRDTLTAAIQASPNELLETWLSDGHSAYYTRLVPAGYNTYLLACINSSSYYQTIYPLIIQLILVLGAVCGIALSIAYTITRKNFQQIDYFINVFSDAEKGIYSSQKPGFVKDEYDIILNNIVQLFVNKSFLQNRLALKEQQQKLAEMTALQLQISPHFLFNTLQTLDFKALEYTGSPTAVNRIIEALSDLLKYSLEKPTSLVTLGNEIDSLKKYDCIQRYRYEDKYILYYEYDEEIRDLPFMRLILQPLIENSLYHGIKPLEGTGFIKLKIFLRREFLHFSVIDTGVGMTKQEVKDLLLKINQAKSERIGLTNVNNRLIMQYGEDSKLRILSKKGMGTCISFRIPLSS